MNFLTNSVKKKVKKAWKNRSPQLNKSYEKGVPKLMSSKELSQNSDKIVQKKVKANLLSSKKEDWKDAHVQITQNTWEKHEINNRNFTDF